MPIHDWARVDAGIFHHFHQAWIGEIAKGLNEGLLPAEYYALAEQITSNLGPDVLTLRAPGPGAFSASEPSGGTALADVPPRVRFHSTAESNTYADKANAVVIHHRSGHDVIAMVQIVSPGNKSSRRRFDAFVRKAGDAMAAGIHLLIIDLFSPGPRDPQGIHPALWQDRGDDFEMPADKPLTCASYLSGEVPEAFVEPVGLGDALPEMPLFLTPDVYVSLPLENTYRAAWDAVPAIWRNVLSGGANA